MHLSPRKTFRSPESSLAPPRSPDRSHGEDTLAFPSPSKDVHGSANGSRKVGESPRFGSGSPAKPTGVLARVEAFQAKQDATRKSPSGIVRGPSVLPSTRLLQSVLENEINVKPLDTLIDMPVSDFIKQKFPTKLSKWSGWCDILSKLDIDTVNDVRDLTPEIWNSLEISPVLKSGLESIRQPADYRGSRAASPALRLMSNSLAISDSKRGYNDFQNRIGSPQVPRSRLPEQFQEAQRRLSPLKKQSSNGSENSSFKIKTPSKFLQEPGALPPQKASPVKRALNWEDDNANTLMVIPNGNGDSIKDGNGSTSGNNGSLSEFLRGSENYVSANSQSNRDSNVFRNSLFEAQNASEQPMLFPREGSVSSTKRAFAISVTAPEVLSSPSKSSSVIPPILASFDDTSSSLSSSPSPLLSSFSPSASMSMSSSSSFSSSSVSPTKSSSLTPFFVPPSLTSSAFVASNEDFKNEATSDADRTLLPTPEPPSVIDIFGAFSKKYGSSQAFLHSPRPGPSSSAEEKTQTPSSTLAEATSPISPTSAKRKKGVSFARGPPSSRKISPIQSPSSALSKKRSSPSGLSSPSPSPKSSKVVGDKSEKSRQKSLLSKEDPLVQKKLFTPKKNVAVAPTPIKAQTGATKGDGTDEVSEESAEEPLEKGFYIVNVIKARRWNKKKQQYEYLINWKGYPDSSNSWEPPACLLPNLKDVMDEFDEQADMENTARKKTPASPKSNATPSKRTSSASGKVTSPTPKKIGSAKKGLSPRTQKSSANK